MGPEESPKLRNMVAVTCVTRMITVVVMTVVFGKNFMITVLVSHGSILPTRLCTQQVTQHTSHSPEW